MSWDFGDKQVLVFGLAASGQSTVRALVAAGVSVIAWDDREEQRDAAIALGATCIALADLDWSAIASVILSPGIPLTHPEPHDAVKAARAHDVDVIGDVELFCRQQRPGKIIAITGTNGKSTTTALIGHILDDAGCHVHVGGNIGTPVLDLPIGDDKDIYVLELSSYQIDLCPSMQADIAILLNITPDHLSRHGGLEGYRAVKKKLLEQQPDNAVAILGDDVAQQIDAANSLSRLDLTIVAVEGDASDVYVKDGQLYDRDGDVHHHIMDLTRCACLPGAHNWQNAACAWAACRAAGLGKEAIIAGLHSFGGLAHRMEQVGVVDGIRFVNDSKATNAEAAAPALKSYDNIYWILGGQAKEGGIDSLGDLLTPVSKAYTIGAAGPEFASKLRKAGITVEECTTLDKAVPAARADALADVQKGGTPVVLLSPACASWDQFSSFEHRGDTFRDAVTALHDNGRAA